MFPERILWRQETDFPLSNLTIAAAIEGPITGNPAAKLVVVGDGDFCVNGDSQQAQQINQDNVNFMANTIDWLSDDTGLIELRTKGITNRPLEQIEDSEKTWIKIINFVLPIVLILLYGILRNQRNRLKKLKRMQENYI